MTPPASSEDEDGGAGEGEGEGDEYVPHGHKSYHHSAFSSTPLLSSASSLPVLHSVLEAIEMVQCSTCGKEYKHRSCLLKHLWEHHQGWAATKRLRLTKHQRAQLLEGADILSRMSSR